MSIVVKNKRSPKITLIILLGTVFISTISCNTKNNTVKPKINNLKNNVMDTLLDIKVIEPQKYKDPFFGLNIEAQLMTVLRRVFQDTRDNLWFVGDEVFCYNGKTLTHFSSHKTFHGAVVRQIKEDKQGNLWFGTSNGLIKYSPKIASKQDTGSFTKFVEKNGLVSNDVWSMTIDRKGVIWIGTFDGVSRFDGNEFLPFSIPKTKSDVSRGVTSPKIVHSITEDSKGNIWFATNGGAYVFNGTILSNISEKDGLCNNSINDILEDKNGNIWFATHHKGVCFWDGNSFTQLLPVEGDDTRAEAWSLYEDNLGHIWFPIENKGIYRYDGASLTNFYKKEGLLLNSIHSIVKDKDGLFWLGGFGGLYRYDGTSFTNVTTHGPFRKN